ncbi:MAG: hypothetical protein EAZ44_01360 [Cytophagia bacterium]|nr:MAG: hypothetical protein EAZ44_01360 [Cytophagia bacterium]TAG44099.1 MAG: hypothetical protein EAZ31_03060 [Cytophagia bacterium]
MSIQPRTPTLLNEMLDADYAWRKQELSFFKSLIPKESSTAQKTLIRAGVVLLYAHWEGFIKETANTYYKFLTYQEHITNEYQNNIIAILLKSGLNDIVDNKRDSKEIKLIENILNQLNNKVNFPNIAPIKTSNLNYHVFEDVCALTHIEINQLELPERIVEDLLEQRNTIAHGHFLKVSFEDFENIYKKIIDVLYKFKNEV